MVAFGGQQDMSSFLLPMFLSLIGGQQQQGFGTSTPRFNANVNPAQATPNTPGQGFSIGQKMFGLQPTQFYNLLSGVNQGGAMLGRLNTAAQQNAADTNNTLTNAFTTLALNRQAGGGGSDSSTFNPTQSALDQPTNFFNMISGGQPGNFTAGTDTSPANGSSTGYAGLPLDIGMHLSPAIQQQLFENQMAQQHERTAGVQQAFDNLLSTERIRLANENLSIDKARETREGDYQQSQLGLDKQKIDLEKQKLNKPDYIHTDQGIFKITDSGLSQVWKAPTGFAIDGSPSTGYFFYPKDRPQDAQPVPNYGQPMTGEKILDVGQKKFVMAQVLARNPHFGQAILNGYMKEQNLKPGDLNSIRKMGAITGNGDPVQKVLDDPVASLRYLQLSSPGLVSIFDQQVQAAQGELPRVTQQGAANATGAPATPTSPTAGSPPASSGASTGAPSVSPAGGAPSSVAQQPLESKYSLQVTKSGKEAVTSTEPIGKLNGKAVTYSELFDLVSKQLTDRGVADPSGEKRRALTQQWINSTAEHQKLEGQLSGAKSPLTTHATEGR